MAESVSALTGRERCLNRLTWKGAGAVAAALVVGLTMGRVTAKDPECHETTVFAQHKFQPDGAYLRIAPYKEARILRILEGNDPIGIKGYIEIGEPTYQHNPDPIKGEYWFHVTKPQAGWVNSAAVRAAIIPDEQFDPTGMDPDNGPLVPVLPECNLAA